MKNDGGAGWCFEIDELPVPWPHWSTDGQPLFVILMNDDFGCDLMSHDDGPIELRNASSVLWLDGQLNRLETCWSSCLKRRASRP